MSEGQERGGGRGRPRSHGGHAGHHVHAHGPLSAAGAHRWRLQVAFGLVAAYFLVELVAGLVSGSLALLSDAGHMAADVVALGAALVATRVATRPDTTGQRTFGTLARLGGSPRELGAEAMAVVLDSIDRADDPLDRASVSRAFLATSGRESPLGTYSVDELGVARPD